MDILKIILFIFNIYMFINLMGITKGVMGRSLLCILILSINSIPYKKARPLIVLWSLISNTNISVL